MSYILERYAQWKSIGIVFLVASLPLHVHVSSVIIVALTLLTLIKFTSGGGIPFRQATTLSWLLVAFFVLEVFALLYTTNLRDGLTTLEKHQCLVLLPFIFIDFFPDEDDLFRIHSAFIGMIVIVAVVAVVINIQISLQEYERYFHEWRFSHDRITEPVGLQAVYFSFMVAYAVVVLFNWILSRRFSVQVTIALCVLALLLLLLQTALGARTMTVALGLALAVSFLYYVRTLGVTRVLVTASVSIIAIVAFVALNPVVTTRFLDLQHRQTEGSNYDSYLARTNIWKPGWAAIKENFWTGTAPGDAQEVLNAKYTEFGYLEGVDVYNLHNEYLQVVLELGLLGLVVFLALLALQFRKAIKAKQPIYLAFLIIFSLGCVTESMMNRNKGVVTFTAIALVLFQAQNSSLKKS